MNKTTSNNTIQTCVIKASTWNDDKQKASDSENEQQFEQEFELYSSTDILRTSNGICTQGDAKSRNDVHYGLFSLHEHRGSFSIVKNSKGIDDAKFKPENLWMAIQDSDLEDEKYHEHILSEGDVLKLGKVKLRVRELKGIPTGQQEDDGKNDADQNTEAKTKIIQEFLKKCQVKESLNDTELTCRICLDNAQGESNPLVSPCSCTGSVNYIHLDCLKHWIKTKCRVNVTNGCTVYIWKDLDCELCHQPFPDIFTQGETISELVELIKPTKTYVILETIPEMKKFKKIFYVAYLSDRKLDKTFTLGRKIDCQININDPSVSRLHSTIKYSDGKFILQNKSATYGTLILLTDKLELKKDHKTSIKVGRTVLSFSLIDKQIVSSVPEISELPISDPILKNNDKIENLEEEEKENHLQQERRSSIDIPNLSSDIIHNSSFTRLLPVSLDAFDQLDGERHEPQIGHTSFDEHQIKGDLENLDRLSNRIRKVLEECYKTLEDSAKKTQDLNGIFESIDNHHTTEDVTMRQDDNLVI